MKTELETRPLVVEATSLSQYTALMLLV